MKRKLAKKMKVVQSDLSDNNSFNDGITTPQGFTAWCWPHLGGNSMDVRSIHSVSPPVTGHQSPGISQAGTRQPVTGHPGTGHQAVITRHRAPVTSHWALVSESNSRHWSTSHWATRHQSTSHQAPVSFTRHRSISSQSLGPSHYSPGTDH